MRRMSRSSVMKATTRITPRQRESRKGWTRSPCRRAGGRCVRRENLYIRRRLGRDGSPAAVRLPGLGSPGPPRSEISARGRLLGKGQLLEPKSPSRKNARLRAGIQKETEGVTLVSTRHGPRQFPLRPYTDRELGLVAVPRTAPDEEEPGADNEDDCLLYTSDAADDLLCVDLGGRR